MSTLSTHVLDAAHGRPAVGVAVQLERRDGADWTALAGARTDTDGRLRDLGPVSPGHYRLVFDTGTWFASTGVTGFYPEVVVTFTVTDTHAHYHVPLLLSPYSYSTYRGS